MVQFDNRLTEMFHGLCLSNSNPNHNSQRPPLPPVPASATTPPPKSLSRDSFVCLKFERAIRTKGKDHMQHQILPIPSHFFMENTHNTQISNSNSNSTSSSTAYWTCVIFNSCIQKYGLEFIEMTDVTCNVEDYILTKIDGGPYQEYFYIEIPVIVGGVIGYKRYVYVDKSDSGDDINSNQRKKQFPMFLGNEVRIRIRRIRRIPYIYILLYC